MAEITPRFYRGMEDSWLHRTVARLDWGLLFAALSLSVMGLVFVFSATSQGGHGDAFLLRQAIDNLVENASDFAPADSAIEIEAGIDGGQVAIRVADRGPGIPDYARERVFERFYSLPRPDGGNRSSGLGLCFVAEVADLHGGSATLDNRDGGGAIATLRIPSG